MMWCWEEDAALKGISKDSGVAQPTPPALLMLFLPSFETELHEKKEKQMENDNFLVVC